MKDNTLKFVCPFGELQKNIELTKLNIYFVNDILVKDQVGSLYIIQNKEKLSETFQKKISKNLQLDKFDQKFDNQKSQSINNLLLAATEKAIEIYETNNLQYLTYKVEDTPTNNDDYFVELYKKKSQKFIGTVNRLASFQLLNNILGLESMKSEETLLEIEKQSFEINEFQEGNKKSIKIMQKYADLLEYKAEIKRKDEKDQKIINQKVDEYSEFPMANFDFLKNKSWKDTRIQEQDIIDRIQEQDIIARNLDNFATYQGQLDAVQNPVTEQFIERAKEDVEQVELEEFDRSLCAICIQNCNFFFEVKQTDLNALDSANAKILTYNIIGTDGEKYLAGKVSLMTDVHKMLWLKINVN